PSNRLTEIFRTGFAGPAIGFQVVCDLVLGLILFLLSWLVFDRCTREEKDSSPRRWFWRRATTRRSLIPPGLVGPRAITWKDFTFVSGGKVGLFLKFGIIAFLLAVFNVMTLEFGNRSEITAEFEGIALMWISLIMMAVGLAFDAV